MSANNAKRYPDNREDSANVFFKGASTFKDASPNVRFYRNEIPASPNKESIQEILTYWNGNYVKLEENHNYIQWLFPNRLPGVNRLSSVLTDEEIQIIKTTPELKERVMEAFKMMLDFYGMKLNEENQFELAKNSEERLKELNIWRNHNFQRITRILLALKELGHDKFMLSWMKFLADLIYKEKKLNQAEESFDKFWIGSLDAEDKIKIVKYRNELLQNQPKSTSSGLERDIKEPSYNKHLHSRSKYAKEQISLIPETNEPRTDKWGFLPCDTTNDTEEITSPANTTPNIIGAPSVPDSPKDNVISTNSSTISGSTHNPPANAPPISDSPKDNVIMTSSPSTAPESTPSISANAPSIPDRSKNNNVITTVSPDMVPGNTPNISANPILSPISDMKSNTLEIAPVDISGENIPNINANDNEMKTSTKTNDSFISKHTWNIFTSFDPFT